MTRKIEVATFAGGCFWCMVKPFDQWDGVQKIISGYTGGSIEHPKYEQVKTGTTGHYEAVQITFDPNLISFEQILALYWPQIDPTDSEGQFQDRGPQYRAAVFYHSASQKEAAEKSRQVIKDSNKFQNPIVTEIIPASIFYPAEEYHQDFYKTNKEAYQDDRNKSGRDEFIVKYWD